jgi:hypothetical protein
LIDHPSGAGINHQIFLISLLKKSRMRKKKRKRKRSMAIWMMIIVQKMRGAMSGWTIITVGRTRMRVDQVGMAIMIVMIMETRAVKGEYLSWINSKQEILWGVKLLVAAVAIVTSSFWARIAFSPVGGCLKCNR